MRRPRDHLRPDRDDRRGEGAGRPAREAAKDVKHIVAISSGKGGVGKSTMTVNLARALAQTGAKVGLLDCDVHGPDVPMMMGLSGAPDQIQVDGKTVLVPKERRGVKTMSIGYLVPDEQPVIWRGPMVHSFIRQMLTDVQWESSTTCSSTCPPAPAMPSSPSLRRCLSRAPSSSPRPRPSRRST